MFHQVWHELWILLFVILIVIGVFAAQGLIIGFGMMGLVVTGIAWLWTKVSLEDVTYERHLSQRRMFSGEEFSMTLTLTNKKPVPLGRVEIRDAVPNEVEIKDAEMQGSASSNDKSLRHSTSVAWYERIRWTHQLTCSQRGLYRLGPAKASSGDLFGFFSDERTIAGQDYFLVYPEVVPLPELGLPASRPLGDVRGGMRIFQDISRPSGIRDYQRGDPLKTVDWKTTARMQRLQVRTFEPSSTITVIICASIETTERHWEGYSPEKLEWVITAAASVATYAADHQYSLGLFSNGAHILADRPIKIPANRSPEQLTIILEALATIQPLTMSSMASQLTENARRFPIGATLVVIAAIMSPELVDAISNLGHQSYRIVLLYGGDGPCPEMPEGVLVHELSDHLAKMELAREFGPR